MTTQTADSKSATPQKTAGFNRFDSPWFNPRFITGVVMIGLIVGLGIIGPLFWDTRLALVASSPLNLPPAWVGSESNPAEEQISNSNAAPTVAVTATQNSGFGSGGLGGSGLTTLMTTQTVPAAEVTPTTNSGFGSGGLGGSGLTTLMTTQTVPAAEVTPTTNSGFGSGGLGGSGLTTLMTTQTTTPAAAATPTPASSSSNSVAVAPSTSSKPIGDPAHPLGTDNSGRDMLAVLIVGAPASLRVGVIAASIGMFIGIVLGFAAGFLGGWVDNVVRTASDVAFTIPSLAVLLVISAYLRRVDLDTMAILLSLFSWPVPTRLIRAQVLTLRERGYIRMAQLSGLSTFDIMFREMMPNLLPYLAASLAGNISGAILAATSLEALGLGPTRYPTLGTTIFNALRATAIMRNMWWWWGLPVLVLMFIFTGLFQLATGLDEIANPRLRGAQGK